MTIPGATTGDVFLAYVVVMDNLRAHKVSGVAEAMVRRGAEVVYLPPYSPDLSPIEASLRQAQEVEAQDGAA